MSSQITKIGCILMKGIDPTAGTLPIEVPREIANCPICGAGIVIDEIHEWESESGKPLSISVNCVTEPDIDGDEWWDWFDGHWSMPYVDWLPVENIVLKWLQENYRCI